MLVGALMFGGLFLLLLLGMPISGALGLVGLLSLLICDPVTLKGVPFVIWNSSTSFTLVAAPLFSEVMTGAMRILNIPPDDFETMLVNAVDPGDLSGAPED